MNINDFQENYFIKPEIEEVTHANQPTKSSECVQAADKIRSAWLKFKTRLDEPLYFISLKLRPNITTVEHKGKKYLEDTVLNEIREGKWDDTITQCLEHCYQRKDLWGIRFLAYSIFSNRLQNTTTDKVFLAKDLAQTLNSNTPDWTDIRSDFLKAFEILKSTKNICSTGFNKRLNTISKIDNIYWKYTENLNPKRLVNVMHGGGFFYLNDFLRGYAKGYPLERVCSNDLITRDPGVGIQVHPEEIELTEREANDWILKRSEYYASQAYQRLDIPSILTGTIPAEMLEPARNNYEAGIHQIDAKKGLKNWGFRILKFN